MRGVGWGVGGTHLPQHRDPERLHLLRTLAPWRAARRPRHQTLLDLAQDLPKSHANAARMLHLRACVDTTHDAC